MISHCQARGSRCVIWNTLSSRSSALLLTKIRPLANHLVELCSFIVDWTIATLTSVVIGSESKICRRHFLAHNRMPQPHFNLHMMLFQFLWGRVCISTIQFVSTQRSLLLLCDWCLLSPPDERLAGLGVEKSASGSWDAKRWHVIGRPYRCWMPSRIQAATFSREQYFF